MKISLIALDLDDTLLDSRLGISEPNKAAVRAAEDAGIDIVLASGRNYASLKEYAKVLELDRPGNFLICSNGAETLATEDGRSIEHLTLTEAFCHEATEAVEALGLSWQVYMDGKIYSLDRNRWALLDQHLTGQPLVDAPPKKELFAGGQTKFVVPGDPARIAEVYPLLAATFRDRAEIVTSKPYFLEILPLGADKGSALVRLSGILGFPMEEVMAIGDAMNDLTMVKVAGWGCAPANALEEIKAAARVVSPRTHDEDAVADLIWSIALADRRAGENSRGTVAI
ncbi:MAG: Cof-type HAD-IIB family hydrolase [Spirochaetota bacterium]